MNAPSDTELAVLAVRAGASLLQRGIRAATAESCTGGFIAKLLTDVPGSSQWFDCGFITYSNRSKQRELNVRPETLHQYGAVSEQTVIEMASGALLRSGVDRALAVSGVAGPDGGTPVHPVGDVWFGVGLKRGSMADVFALHRRFVGDRDAVRRQAAAYALELLLEQ